MLFFVSINEVVFLVLYEVVYFNRNFFIVFSYVMVSVCGVLIILIYSFDISFFEKF